MKKGEALAKMIHLASERHADQFDRSGKPYILHPLTVMMLLGADADEELQCIAVGHDIVEDTPTTYAELREIGFSERIIDGIRRLTKVPGQSYEEYQAEVLGSRDAMLVKRADLRHNTDLTRLKGVRDKDIERNVKYMKFFYLIEQKLSETYYGRVGDGVYAETPIVK